MKLNRIIYIFILGAFLTGCHGDLDITQKTAITSKSMWQDEDDAVAAVNGMFNRFRSSFSYGYMYWGEYRTGLWGDGLAGQTARDQVYENTIPIDHGYANWEGLYTTINEANLILKYTPDINFTSSEGKNYVLANAYFVRAFCYYWIGRIWGDAPLLLNGFESPSQEDLYPTRSPAEDIFAQVGNDIDQAVSLIPASSSNRHLATRASANMLKTDYCLWMYKVRNGGDSYLNDAASAIQVVLNDSSYGMEENFADIFSNEESNEVILSWKYTQDEYTGGYPADYLVPVQYVSTGAVENPIKVGSHQQWCFYTEAYKNFLSEYDFDKRRVVSFDTYFDEPKNATFQWINKYCGTWLNGSRVFDSDIIVYRYSEAVLFDAEIKLAKNDIDGAVSDLNIIAKRAYGRDDFYSNSSTVAGLEQALVNERMKEFAAEGKLWWDFIRFGVAFQKVPSLVGRENEQNILLWPVSQTSINKNPNIKQTPGYDK